VGLKRLDAKTNWLAIKRQSWSNFDFDFDFDNEESQWITVESSRAESLVQLRREYPVEEDYNVSGSDMWTVVTSCIKVQ
jgi:hypothetical protein